MTVTASLPASIAVGQTQPASITITNAGTPDDPSFRLCRSGDGGVCAGQPGITLIPSCGQDVGPQCTPAGADPGVFAVNEPAIGAMGTVCAGVTFLVTQLDGTYGRMRFEPAGGIDTFLSTGESCRVEFTVTALRLPSIDARPAAGAQTVAIASASAQSYLGFLVGPASGSSVATVTPAPPPAPSVTGTVPVSPGNDNAPEVTGSAPAGTTVSLYTDATCSGAMAAQGSAAAFASPGLTVQVPDNTTTTFRARATDPSTGLTSDCSTSSRTYVEDSIAPDTAVTSGPSGPTIDPRPFFTFTSDEPGASFQCRVDDGAFASCVSPFQTSELVSGLHTFAVRAIDGAGNVDPTPATRIIVLPGGGPSPTQGSSLTPSSTETPNTTGCHLRGNTIVGTSDNDNLDGTAKTDIMSGLDAADLLRGFGGADCLFGGSGTDRLLGGTGADSLFGGTGNDTLSGEAGNDRLSGGAGNDGLNGGAGNDTLIGGDGNDRLTDRAGTDRFQGGAGNDTINARDRSLVDRRGRDRISCGPGRDTVLANKSDIVARDCEIVRTL